jgi:hypothetical protein
MGNDVQMEAASLTLPTRREGLAAALRRRRCDRRARRLLADAERFDRAASRLESTLDPDAWQVAHLRRSAAQLRELAAAEAGIAAMPAAAA